MMKRKAFWVLLAAGMTVVSSGVVNAQSTMAFPRVGMLGEFKQKSLVGSWVETVNFLDGDQKGRVLKSLVSFHDDGTEMSSGQGSVMFDPPPKHPKAPQTGTVTSDGVGAWTQTDWRTFVYTEKDLFSDFSGNLTGFLKVRGKYTLSASGDEYTGISFYEVLATDGETVLASGNVTNKGERIRVELPPEH
jgi:hypothetical protein